MGLARFIHQNTEAIIGEWVEFARTLEPAAKSMDDLALRNDVERILKAIAKDIETSQSAREQSEKSRGMAPPPLAETAATSHGAERQRAGFDLKQLASEFRALRASVLRLWSESEKQPGPRDLYEMTRFNEAIDQALAESVVRYSQEVGRSRDTFIAILGHDLRSPLNAIAMSAQTLAAPNLHDNVRLDAAVVIRRSTATMESMINDLLEYTRARLGKGIPVHLAPINLETVCRSTIHEVEIAHPQHSFRLEMGGDLNGNFDALRMRQALSNLLNNAVQHGGRSKPVHLVARGEKDAVVLEVRNHGRPIRPEKRQAIFDALVQGEPEATDPRRSIRLGLGLFIAREIVLAHGGTIEVESNESKGTVFTIRIRRR